MQSEEDRKKRKNKQPSYIRRPPIQYVAAGSDVQTLIALAKNPQFTAHP